MNKLFQLSCLHFEHRLAELAAAENYEGDRIVDLPAFDGEQFSDEAVIHTLLQCEEPDCKFYVRRNRDELWDELKALGKKPVFTEKFQNRLADALIRARGSMVDDHGNLTRKLQERVRAVVRDALSERQIAEEMEDL